MGTFEIIIIVILIATAIWGFSQGLVSQLASMIALVVSIIACRIFGPMVAEWATSGSTDNSALYTVLAYAATAIAAYFVVWLIARMIRGLIHGLHLGILDRLGGALFKVAKWLLICSLCYNLYVSIFPAQAPDHSDVWEERLLLLAPTVFGSETAQELIQTVNSAVTGNQ